MRKILSLCAVLLFCGLTRANIPTPTTLPSGVVVHEWGTFTALQDEQGRALGGINTDDEPVPAFVHNIRSNLLTKPGDIAPIFAETKGVATGQSLASVTMRLETPVIYFHLPEGSPPIDMNVHVAFRGGWLSQFYPDALVDAPGIGNGRTRMSALTSKTIGQLSWPKLTVGARDQGPKTTANVWLAPRKVNAAQVKTAAGETERFLFYRGIGHLDSPLRVARTQPAGSEEPALLQLHSQLDPSMKQHELSINNLWLVDIRADRTVAFRDISPVRVSADDKPETVLAATRAGFDPADYSAANLARLRASMKTAIVAEGLFADEADALLNTWEASYFKSPGERLFFLVPTAWTDHVLPLEVAPASETKRIMVGRIELVSPAQRQALATIAKTTTPADTNWLYTAMEQSPSQDLPARWNKLMSGETSVETCAKDIPAEYRAFIALGRFRNALLLDAKAHNAGIGITKFITAYGLDAYPEVIAK